MTTQVPDATAYIQSLLDKGGEVIIPEGTYRITSTLKINSNTHVKAHKNARLFLCGDTPKYRGDFLLDNSDHVNGNENITIEGGIWDGNNQGKYNTKDPDLFNPNAWSGSTMNFFRVKNLKLRDMVFANSVIYSSLKSEGRVVFAIIFITISTYSSGDSFMPRSIHSPNNPPIILPMSAMTY